MVGTERLELSHLAALEPKSSASTNFATSPSGYQLNVGFLSNFGRGSRIRTLTNGFGDRHATITPILYFHPISSYSNIDWWGRRDSNSHTSRRWNLNPVRLPIPPRPHVSLLKTNGVDDGARTHDHRNHNPGLYQLSYAHHNLSSHRTESWRTRQGSNLQPTA